MQMLAVYLSPVALLWWALVPSRVIAFQGKATFYDLTEGAPVACGVPVRHSEIPYLAAVDRSVFDVRRPASCGKCIQVRGPRGTIRVRIVDRCEGCGWNGVDLSREGFAQIAAIRDGRVQVQWDWVDCTQTQGRSGSSTATLNSGTSESAKKQDAKPNPQGAPVLAGNSYVEQLERAGLTQTSNGATTLVRESLAMILWAAMALVLHLS